MFHYKYPFIIQSNEAYLLKTREKPLPIIHPVDSEGTVYCLLSRSERLYIDQKRQKLAKLTPIARKIKRAKPQDGTSPAVQYSVILQENKAYILYRGKNALIGFTHHCRVKLAQDLETLEWLAVKIIDTQFFGEHRRQKMQQIEDEANFLKNLSHLRDFIKTPNIQENEQNSKYYLMMPLYGGYGGGSLDRQIFHKLDSLRNSYPKRELSLPIKFKMALSVVNEVIKIHDQNVLHRDIKCLNFVWDRQRMQAYLIDYGHALQLSPHDEGGVYCPDNRICGTAGYVAPEIINYKLYKQTLTPYFYQRFGYDTNKPILTGNPYNIRRLSDTTCKDSQNKISLDLIVNTLNWFSYLIYEAQFANVRKIVHTHFSHINMTSPFEPKNLDITALAQQQTNLLVKAIVLSSHSKTEQSQSHIFDYIASMTYTLKRIQKIEQLKILFDKQYLRRSNLNLTKIFTDDDFQSILDAHKSMLWVLPCYAPLYSKASDTFSTGRVLAEIFTQNDQIIQLNRPYTDLTGFDDVLKPDRDLSEPLYSVYEMIGEMVNADPNKRMKLSTAKKILERAMIELPPYLNRQRYKDWCKNILSYSLQLTRLNTQLSLKTKEPMVARGNTPKSIFVKLPPINNIPPQMNNISTIGPTSEPILFSQASSHTFDTCRPPEPYDSPQNQLKLSKSFYLQKIIFILNEYKNLPYEAFNTQTIQTLKERIQLCLDQYQTDHSIAPTMQNSIYSELGNILQAILACLDSELAAFPKNCCDSIIKPV